MGRHPSGPSPACSMPQACHTLRPLLRCSSVTGSSSKVQRALGWTLWTAWPCLAPRALQLGGLPGSRPGPACKGKLLQQVWRQVGQQQVEQQALHPWLLMHRLAQQRARRQQTWKWQVQQQVNRQAPQRLQAAPCHSSGPDRLQAPAGSLCPVLPRRRRRWAPPRERRGRLLQPTPSGRHRPPGATWHRRCRPPRPSAQVCPCRAGQLCTAAAFSLQATQPASVVQCAWDPLQRRGQPPSGDLLPPYKPPGAPPSCVRSPLYSWAATACRPNACSVHPLRFAWMPRSHGLDSVAALHCGRAAGGPLGGTARHDAGVSPGCRYNAVHWLPACSALRLCLLCQA